MILDYLIVGRGLAGTILSDFLIRKNQKIKIIDNNPKVSSSKVAAGVINPITGKRFVKTWMADEIFPFAKQYYQALEAKYNKSFYNEYPIHRFFGNVEDENNWQGRISNTEYKSYIGQRIDTFPSNIKGDFGGFEILQGGNLDINPFLESFHAENADIIINEQFDYNELNIDSIELKCKDLTFKNVIFCEGFGVKDNPYFQNLPFNFAKGEILELENSEFQSDILYNKNGFILPTKKGTFLAGATFDWKNLNFEPTEKGTAQVMEKVLKITPEQFKIVNKRAAVRPTVKDRRPFIGTHPKNKNIHIFNGMGSKGVTLIPYFAQHFVEHLLENKELMKEVDISRYYDYI